MPFLKTLAVLTLAVVAGLLGRRCSRLRGNRWLTGFFLPLPLVLAVALARWIPALEFRLPFSWLMAGRTELITLAAAFALMLSTLIPRINRRMLGPLVSVLRLATVVYFTFPFFQSAVVRGHLAQLETTVDADGICLQSNSYTCGPAAAVTALRVLGIRAEESDIAILARTTPGGGTDPASLCLALRKRYAQDGLSCEYRFFQTVPQLRGKEPVVALVKFSFMIDHYVTVLEVTDTHVSQGNPLTGLETVPLEDFERVWRRSGLVLTTAER